MFRLALRNVLRRPLRNGLAVGGLAATVAVLACLLAFAAGYQRGIRSELDRMGIQLMLVPLGCPYDAAAHVLKGNSLDASLPESVLETARRDPAVVVAAPLLMTSLPQPREGRTDLWVGLDETALELKPWWRAGAGQGWFASEDSVILGCDAAEVEMRAPGDLFYTPEGRRTFHVSGVLARSGTSDDSLFFVPLRTAQAMFGQAGRLTAVAIRLRDPSLVAETAERLQRIPGAQVVTMTEMMGTFLNLVSAARTLLLSLTLLAVSIGMLGVFNALLAAVVEQTQELAVLRAVGASRLQVFLLLSTESVLLGGAGTVLGILLAASFGPALEGLVKQFVPLAPAASLLRLGATTLWQCAAIGMGAGAAAGLYPAWRAGRVQPAPGISDPT